MTEKPTIAELAKAARIEEGRAAFARGDSSDTLRYTQSAGDSTENSMNIDRLVGYLDAAAGVKRPK